MTEQRWGDDSVDRVLENMATKIAARDDEIERLRAGLQEIADGMPTVMQPTTDFAQRLLAGDTDAG